MKNIIPVLIILLFVNNCGHQPQEPASTSGNFVEPKYDTTPVDSFSRGATSAAVARSIRLASKSYKDSLKLALQKELELQKQKSLEEKVKKEEEKAQKNQQEKKVNKEQDVPKENLPVTQ